MLQLTETAAKVFRKILDQPGVEADVVRIVPEEQTDGQMAISVEVVDRPAPTDQPVEAEGVTVVLAPELAPKLDDAVLDAKETEEGADLFLRAS
jgi:Fe-S cluster assembly iron-binding protein IscA